MGLAIKTAAPIRRAKITLIQLLSLVLIVSTLSAISIVNAPRANASACSGVPATTTWQGDGNTGTSGVTYTLQRFTTVATNCTWTIPLGVSSIDVLAVGGGGGAGFGNNGGGGGAGKLIVSKNPFNVTAGSTLTITVGAGGLGGGNNTNNQDTWTRGQNGNTTSVVINSTTYNAIGGGGGSGGPGGDGFAGGSSGGASGSGGSGSGAGGIRISPEPTPSDPTTLGSFNTFGNSGSRGGGGAGGAASGLTGGGGLPYWGLNLAGGGGAWASGIGATEFGGGSAKSGFTTLDNSGEPGAPNTGGGGGGGNSGGSGVLVLRYVIDATAPTVSSTSVSSTGATGTTLNFTSSETGTYYYKVQSAASADPADAAAVESTATANSSASASANSVAISGLSANTDYEIFVIVKDAAGNRSTVTKLTFSTLAAAVAPTIGTQPTAAARTVGQSVTFTVAATASDSGVLSYQWQKGGSPITGATSASYTFTPASTSDAGEYRVVVTNTKNSTTAFTNSSAMKLAIAGANNYRNFVRTTPSQVFSAGNSFKSSSAVVPSGSFTLEGWIRESTVMTNQSPVFSQGSLNSNSLTLHVDGSTRILKLFYGNASIEGTTTIVSDKWYHHATTYDGTTLRLYINGALQSTATNVSLSLQGDFMIGGNTYYSTHNSHGHQDQFKVWTGALSADEIASSMHSYGEGSVTGKTLRTLYDFNHSGDTATLTDVLGGFNLSANGTGTSSTWASSALNVTFDEQGGSPAATDTTFDFYTRIANPGSPTKAGHTFSGWSRSSNGGVVTFPYIFTPLESVTLYAIWSGNSNTVTFNANDGSGTPATSTQSITSGTATALTANSFTRTGYAFNGWNTNADGTSGTGYSNQQSVTLTGGLTLFAKWIQTFQLTVTQSSNGTISPSSTVVNSGSNQTLTFTPSAGYNVSTITVNGTALTGSNLKNAIGNGYTFTNITTTHTITATYASIVTTGLLLNLDATNTTSLSAANGNSAAGWASIAPGGSITPSGGASVTASNGTTGVSPPPRSVYFGGSSSYLNYGNASNVALSSNTVTVETWLNLSTVNSDWDIIATKWFANTSRNENVSTVFHFGFSNNRLNVYARGVDAGICEGLQSNTTFNSSQYSKWIHVAFTIDASGNLKFYLNGVEDGSHTGCTFTDKSNALLIVGDLGANNSFSGSMSRFRMYNSALSATDIKSNYMAEALTFDADYLVNFNYNSATSGNTLQSASFRPGGTAITLPTPSRTNFTFGGWYVASDFSGTALGSTYSPTSSLTIYAKWTGNVATLSGLALSSGTLSTTFASATTTYSASVANSVDSITVTPSRSQENATITVNGTAVTSGSASGAIALNVGSNTITVVVTAQSGSTTGGTYTLTVTRAAGISTVSLTIPSFTFTGSPQGPDINDVTKTGSTGNVTFAYAGRDGTSYTSSPTKPTNAGTYTVTATVAADTNFATVSASGNFAITAAGLSVPASLAAATVAGVASAITVTFSAVAGASSYTVQLFNSAGTQLGSDYTSFTSGSKITGLTASTAYSVKIIAVGNGTNYTSSAASSGVSVTTLAAYYLNFAGSSPQYGSVASTVIPSTGNFTVEAWIAPTATSSREPVIVNQGAGSGLFLLRLSSQGKLEVVRGSAAVECSTNAITLNSWTHVAASINGATATCYVNGVGQTPAVTLNTVALGTNFFVGIYSSGTGSQQSNFAGQIDEIKIWNTTRTQAQIADNRNLAPLENATGLVAYYPFDATTGTTVVDVKNSANNLTLYSTMSWLPLIRTVAYEAGTNGSGTTASQSGTSDRTAAITLKSAADASGITRAGFSISAWNTNAGGTGGTSYALSASYLGATDLTLYPTWTANVVAPTIGTQPIAAARTVGQSVTFTVVASRSDDGVLSYQWQKGGADIPGATSASYTFITGNTTDAGNYQVVVTNTKNTFTATTTSTAVALTMSGALTITTPNSGLSGSAGTAFTTLNIASAGGSGTNTFAVATGTLPGGLSLSTSGAITGTPTTVGTQAITVRVTDSNLATATTSSFTIAITAGTATKVAVTRASVGTQRGAAFSTQPQVTVQDAGGNTVTASTAVVTATVSAGGTLVGTVTATASSGVATFTGLGVNGTIGTTYTITYTVSDLTVATATVTLTGTTCDASFTCQIGDTGPGGGIIFYVAPAFFTQVGASGSMCTTNCKYLEAAPTSGTRAWTDARYGWSGNTNTAIGTTAQGTAIGTGYGNTLAIVGQSNTANKAATITRAYLGPNNLSDWFLPSRDESNQMCKWQKGITGSDLTNLGTVCTGSAINTGIGAAGFVTVNWTYWTSTERNATQASYQYMNNGAQGGDVKTWDFYVRPIRAFGPAPIVISEAAIAGVTAPVAGATPVTTTTAGTGYTGTVTWASSGGALVGNFGTGATYTATITLTAAAGYTLTGVTANFFTVTGATPVTNLANSGVVSAVFPATTSSNVATLSALTLTTATLSSTFASGTTSYTSSVVNGTTSITVTPTRSQSNATITVNGTAVTSGSASGAISLNVGANTITVVVTAQDGSTTATYTVTVTRAGSNVATLSALVLSSGTLSTTFASGTNTYTASVANSVSTGYTITPTTTQANATTVQYLGADGTTAFTGALSVGANVIRTVVTAQDGTTTSTYTVTVTRAVQAFTITYAAGSGGSGTGPTSPVTVNDGATFTTPANTFIRTGYTFAGWSSETSTVGANLTFPTSGTVSANVTLTATWTPINCTIATTSASGYTTQRLTGVGSCAWTTPTGVSAIEVAVVGGGGGGGFGSLGGGGGAGEVLVTGTSTTVATTVVSGTSTISATPGETTVVVIGSGGTSGAPTGATETTANWAAQSATSAAGGNGSASAFGSISATGGGGGGGSFSVNGARGGSGGGGANGGTGGAVGSGSAPSGWTSFKTAGSNGALGGGGGAGGTGSATRGGSGITVLGNRVAGGGGGWGFLGSENSAGDTVLGGNGRTTSGNWPYTGTAPNYTSPGTAGTGTGGGAGAPGGSGSVIIRYAAVVDYTYDANSGTGTAPAGGSVQGGKAFTTAANPFTRTGYTFAGWYTTTTGTGGTAYTENASNTMQISATAIILYAKWTASALVVAYDEQGGSSISDGSVNVGASIAAAPTAPLRAGYTLSGWSTTSTGSVVTFPYAHGQSANFTLYAIWTVNTLTVTYNSQGGSSVTAGSVATDAKISAAPTPPTRAGYTFSGWSTTSTGSVVSFTGGYTHGQTANFTLFAIWAANALTITYDSKSGTSVANGTVNTGASISAAPTAPTRTGYTLDGWSATDGGTVVIFPYAHGQTANFTLYAKWTGTTNTITYDSKSGSSVASGSFVTGGSIASAPTAPTRAGYTLSGWSLTDGGSVITYPYSPVATSGITLYAIWAAISCSPTTTTAGGYTVYTFTTAGTCFWTVPDGVTGVEILAVAGGGGGGYSYDNSGAGGGAGGQLKTGTATLSTTLEVTVGAGGSAGISTSQRGGTGANSVVSTVTALGGTGGCASRATTCSNSAQATSSAAANGGIGGAGGASGRGGGGSNTTGSTTSSTTGGTGTASTYSGTSVTYGVGGAGGTARAFTTNITGATGGANTGNGGGGASAKSVSGDVNGGAGGSGLVIVRVASALTVTFNSQSGSEVAAGSTATGGSISAAPTAPTRANYSFLGWFTASTGGTAIAFPYVHGQSANFTLYAQWSLSLYAITFNVNGGTGSMGNQSVTHGVAVNLNANLYSRANYVFYRWATAADGTGTTYNNSAQVTLTAATTLYAQWTANTYVVTYSYNGGDGGDSTATSSFTTAGTAITLPVPTRTGFTFAGWHSDAALTTLIGSSNGSGTYSPTGGALSLNAYAKWTAVNYTFTYNSNSADSGDVPTETSKQITQTATVKANTGSLVRAGYTFNGWNTASNGTGDNYLSGSLFTVASANVILYAKWTANTYTVTYNTNSGTGNAQRSSANVTSDSYTTGGSSVVFPGVGTLERTGYTFGGWNTSAAGTGTDYAATNTYTTVSNVIFYVKWNPVTYTISYNGNSSDGGTAPTTGGYTTGQASPYVVLANSYTKTSSIFGGWNTADNGTGTSYSPGASITTLTNIVLYAVWIPQFTLHYAINGGTVTSGSLPADALLNINTAVTVFSALGRTGYTFGGWTNGVATIAPGGSFNIVQDSVLTAKWTAINYSISYNSDGGTEAPATSTKQIGQSFSVGTAVSKPGYNFTGWSNGSSVVGADAVVVMGSANIAYTAQWVARVYTVSYDWNGGRGTAVADVNYTFGTTAITLPLVGDRVRDGYTFTGWSESSGGSALSATYIPSQSRTLYALWTIGNFTVTYNLSGGTLANASAAVQNGSATVLPLPTRANFVFDGWHTATTGGSSVGSNGASFTPTASQTVYARWIQSSLYGITNSLTRIGSVVTVANVANTFSGANSNSSVSVSVPQNALPAGTTINFDMVGNSSRATGLLPNVAYLISIAISWLTADGFVPDTTANNPISVVISNATIKAGAAAYAIVNNVSTLLGTASQDGTITIALTSDPEIVVAATKPDAPTSVTATSNGNQQSVISWSAPASNGGSAITGYTATASGGAGTCTTSTTSCTISSLANGTAYTFTVTATNSVGTSVASTSASATTAALYAVTFDAKSGTAVTSGSFLTASTVSEPTAPTRTGYSFAGWSATDGGSAITYPYAPGVTTAITLFARWDALDNAVTFDSKSGSDVTAAIFSSGGTVAEPTAPTRSGFTFAGWSATDGGSAVTFPYAPGVVTDIVLYARWTVVSQNNSSGSGGGSSTPAPSVPSEPAVPSTPVRSNVTVVAPVTVIGDQDAKVIAVDIAIPAAGSNTKPPVIKIDKASEKFIAEVKVVKGKLVLTPETGFSGKKTVSVTITENGADRIIQIPLTVLPEAVTKPVLTPTATNRSNIRWTASPNADAYTVYLNGKKVCSTSALSCSVKTVLGPDANIEIVSNGGDRTVSQRVDAEFRQTVPVSITRLVSATITKSTLTRVDTKALDKVIALIKVQGFGTVVISEITTTSKTKALAAARIESIKKYINSKIGTDTVEFEITPVKSRTYFNNISVKG